MSTALEPFASVLFMEAAKGLNRKASAKRARRVAQIGWAYPKRNWPASPPPPGWYDGEDIEEG